MSKYAPLAQFLTEQANTRNEISLSFERVEEIIETDLPPSARKHNAWWANDATTHPQAQQWLGAGWRVSGVDMRNETVTFERDN